MNLISANTIDFHHPNSNPHSNSRIYHIQPSSTIPNGNKVQQLKNRKGINQQMELKPHQVQQIKQGLRASSQLGPASQASRKSAQSRQFAFESDLSNNYASQISGWVNSSILPEQNVSELLDQSSASIKAKVRQGRRDNQDSQASNYSFAAVQSAPRGAKGRGAGVHVRMTNSVLDNHSNKPLEPMQVLNQMMAQDGKSGASYQQNSLVNISKDNLKPGESALGQ